MKKYVHGYSERETQRLNEQSGILEQLLHSGTVYGQGESVLEAGCGVGAQTVILCGRNPECRLKSIDISAQSLAKAQANADAHNAKNVTFQQADILNLPFAAESFDHVFVCFVLEHVDDPQKALGNLKYVLKPGGTLTVIEGDHGSCFWHPETKASLDVWHSMIQVQQRIGHDPLIGRKLYPLLRQAGFIIQDVSPRWVYTDALRPDLMHGVLDQIIVPMTNTAREQALQLSLIDETTWEKGIADLARSGTPPDGTFFYTWFKATGTK
ncbi:methyltransferase domain-containing protein [candidate division KSB1 bacterium]|nr:methyltransferase domain-containing protein [candidate division KSB1 bacterium]